MNWNPLRVSPFAPYLMSSAFLSRMYLDVEDRHTVPCVTGRSRVDLWKPFSKGRFSDSSLVSTSLWLVCAENQTGESWSPTAFPFRILQVCCRNLQGVSLRAWFWTPPVDHLRSIWDPLCWTRAVCPTALSFSSLGLLVKTPVRLFTDTLNTLWDIFWTVYTTKRTWEMQALHLPSKVYPWIYCLYLCEKCLGPIFLPEFKKGESPCSLRIS